MNDRGPIPSKLYFRIGEVADLVGVEPHVLRYWEREFRTIRPTKSPKGQRVYSHRDVESLMRVRELLYGQGFTIAGARKRLRDKDAPPVQPAPVVEALPVEPTPIPPPPATEPSLARVAEATAGLPARARAELEALKAEVEAYLAELGPAS